MDSDSESSGEDQPRSHHSKKPPQKQPNRTIIIAEYVDITNGNFSLVGGGRDESRSQRSSTPTRNAPRLQSNLVNRPKKRSTGHCDFRSAAEEDAESRSDESEPGDVPRTNRRTAKSIERSGESRLPTEKKKRDQADEGYHTSGTAYRAESKRHPGKGKERSISSSTGESSSSQPQLSSSAGSGKSGGVESDTDPPSHHSNPDEDVLENDEDVDKDRNEEYEDGEDDDASDDVCFRSISSGRMLTSGGFCHAPYTDLQRRRSRQASNVRRCRAGHRHKTRLDIAYILRETEGHIRGDTVQTERERHEKEIQGF